MFIIGFKKVFMLTVILITSAWTSSVFSDDPQRTSSTTSSSLQNKHFEYAVTLIPGVGRAAESYFSPDSQSLIFYGKPGDAPRYQIHTVNTDGSHFQRINNKGNDACSFFFPDGKRIVFTSTMDHPEIPMGNWSDSENYPRGAEIYTSNLDGSNLKRITTNEYYDAEVSVSPDGNTLSFSSSRNNPPGSRMLRLYLMDISELGLQAKPASRLSAVF